MRARYRHAGGLLRLAPHASSGGPLNLAEQVRSLAAHIPRVIWCAVLQSAMVALTLTKL